MVQNALLALTLNQMVAPNVWIDPKNNNNYFLNVQYPERQARQPPTCARFYTAD